MLLKLGIILKLKTGNLAVWLLDYLHTVQESLRGKKKEKNEEKNGISEGFEGRIWTKFPNCPDPKKLRGGWRGIDFTGN